MNRIFIYLIFVGLLVAVKSNDVKAQCKQQIVYSCATNNGKAIYLRDFNTKLKRARNKRPSGTMWSVTLNKGTHYRFNLCTQSGYDNKVVLTLFDARHPEKTKPYVTTKYTNNPKTNNRFDFICKATGTYYVSIRFKEGVSARKSCAVGVLSFVGRSKRR